MRLTTKGRYAVTAMLDLAVHDDGKPIALADIAERQSLSLSYLEQLFAQLRRGGLVSSVRGPGGGYRLARARAEINIAEIVQAVDETVDVTRCGGKGNCQKGSQCIAHHLWMGLSAQIRSFLRSISLADMVDQNKARELQEALSDGLPCATLEQQVGLDQLHNRDTKAPIA